MSNERALVPVLSGYEAITRERQWLITAGARLRVLVAPRGLARPSLHLEIDGQPPVSGQRQGRYMHDLDLAMQVGHPRVGAKGRLRLTLGECEHTWPVQVTSGYPQSLVCREFDPFTKHERGQPPNDILRRAAQRLEDEFAAAEPDVEHMWARFLLGRIWRASGEWSKAVDGYRAAAEIAQHLNVDSWSARFLRAAAFVAICNLVALDVGRTLLDRAEALTCSADVDALYKTDFYLGLLAAYAGDPNRASSHIRNAIDRAIQAAQPPAQLAPMWSTLSTVTGEDLEDKDADLDATTTGVEAVGLRLNRAWSLLRRYARTRDRAALDRVRSLLTEAEASLGPTANSDLWARVRLNLGWCAALSGESADAHRYVRAALAVPELDRSAADEAQFLIGRLLFDEGHPARAMAHLAPLRARLDRVEAGLPSALSCGLLQVVGRAQVASGDIDAGLRTFKDVNARLDRFARHFSTAQRSVFFGERTPIFDPVGLVDDIIDRLTARGEHASAVDVVEQALFRSRNQIWMRTAVEHLPESARERWHALEAEMVALEADGLRTRRARRLPDAERQTSLTLHGRALRRTWDEMQGLLSACGAGPQRPPELAAVLPHLGVGEYVLLDWRRADGASMRWWISRDGVQRAAVECSRDDFEGVDHLYIVGSPGSTLWAGLPNIKIDGQPLMTRIGVSFLPSLASLTRSWSGGERPALVIADPRRDLPWAESDGRWLAQHLSAPLLLGNDATRDAVIEASRGVQRLHFSGHGELSIGTNDAAELQLADKTTLRAEDISLHRIGPKRVVLNGCSTGRGFAAHAMSLPAAFLAAGAGQVLATTRPVPDADASAFIRAFYRHGGTEDSARALWCAADEARRTGMSVWTAYRLIGRRTP